MSRRVYIREFSSLCAAGDNDGLRDAVFARSRNRLPKITDHAGQTIYFCKIDDKRILTEEAIRQTGIDPALRAEALSVEDFVKLARGL